MAELLADALGDGVALRVPASLVLCRGALAGWLVGPELRAGAAGLGGAGLAEADGLDEADGLEEEALAEEAGLDDVAGLLEAAGAAGA